MVMKIGALMQACRERAGLNQIEMAFRIHRTQSFVSKVENGHQEPDVPTFVHWISETNTKEVAVAYICGVDGLAIMQNIMSQNT